MEDDVACAAGEEYERIWRLALPYLRTRNNVLHTQIAITCLLELMQTCNCEDDVVIPALILHDLGWKAIDEDKQKLAFGPDATRDDLTRKHELEGVKIAKVILSRENVENARMQKILEIIDGHDTRTKPINGNDGVVRDADRLWRYSKQGFMTDMERFDKSFDEHFSRLESSIDEWFYTDAAKRIARRELVDRKAEFFEKET